MRQKDHSLPRAVGIRMKVCERVAAELRLKVGMEHCFGLADGRPQLPSSPFRAG